MKHLLLATLLLLFAIATACGGGSNSSSEPFELSSPSVDQIITQGGTVVLFGTFKDPDNTTVDFYYDYDEIWDNENEHAIITTSSLDGNSFYWDTSSMVPGTYYIAYEVHTLSGDTVYYAEFTVTIVTAFVLTSPSEDQIIERGDIVTFTGTMEEPENYSYIHVYYDYDQTWDNGNEHVGVVTPASANVSTDWNTVAMNPGQYHIVIGVSTATNECIFYANFTVTVLGDELFTLTEPSEDITIPQDGSLTISGVLRSVDDFSLVEIYLDPDSDWYNSNEEKIMELTPETYLEGTWQASGFAVGTYEIVIVLYQTSGGRLIGYIERQVTIEAATIPD